MTLFEQDIIGTHLSIRVGPSSSGIPDEVFSHIRTYLSDFESKYSRFIEGNFLHQINLSRTGVLDDDARTMLSYALELAQRTDGYFDPTVGTRLRTLGYGNPDTTIPLQESNSHGIGSTQARMGDYRDIIIDGDTIRLELTIEIEFGGVGKGYLIDQIQQILLPHTSHFLIDFGGDLYGLGGWKVGLESPFAPDEIIGVHVLDGHFLACSAGTKRKWGDHHHLIDPKTGSSATDVVATYIEGGSGMCVDGYATALAVMPWEIACQTLEKTPEISGVLVRHDGSLYQKEGSRSEVFR